MPLKTRSLRLRKRREEPNAITPTMVAIVFRGFSFIPVGEIPEELVRSFWEANREKLMEWWFAGTPVELGEEFGFHVWDEDRQPHLFCRPSAWWNFEKLQHRGRETQRDYLMRLSLLTDREKAVLAAGVDRRWDRDCRRPIMPGEWVEHS